MARAGIDQGLRVEGVVVFLLGEVKLRQGQLGEQGEPRHFPVDGLGLAELL